MNRFQCRATRCSTEDGDDRGHATIEFVAVTLLLLLPIVLGIVVLDRVQSALFAAQNIAAQYLHTHVHQPVRNETHLPEVSEFILRAHHLESVVVHDVEVRCNPACFQSNNQISVYVDVQVSIVDLPFIDNEITSITLHSQLHGTRLQYRQNS